MNYTDHCSVCRQPVIRLRLVEAMEKHARTVVFSKGRFVTSCCGAAPIAKPIALSDAPTVGEG